MEAIKAKAEHYQWVEDELEHFARHGNGSDEQQKEIIKLREFLHVDEYGRPTKD